MSGMGVGLAFAGVATVCFGSNFVVTKKYKSGDGLFFQWVMAAGILTSGIVFWLLQCTVRIYGQDKAVCPPFEPLAVLGGVIWCCGNVWVVPIVKTIGLSMGLLIWGSASMFMGWATGRFGLFGLSKQALCDYTLNDIAIGVAGLALLAFLFVRPTLTKPVQTVQSYTDVTTALNDDEGLAAYNHRLDLTETKLLVSGRSVNSPASAAAQDVDEPTWTDALSPVQKSLFGVTMSIVSGLLYGSNFDPPQYIVDHPESFPGSISDPRAYVFPHFVGIFLTATVFVLVYSVSKRNQPVVYPEILMPGFFSGVIWSLAQISWFYANKPLGLAISFPIISVGPGLVGALWGVFVFGEIRGLRNFIALAAAFLLSAGSAVLNVKSSCSS